MSYSEIESVAQPTVDYKRCIERASRLAGLFSSMRYREALKLLVSHRQSDADTVRYRIHSPKLRHPFTLTPMHSDIAMFGEVIGRNVYSLSQALHEMVEGRPIVDIGANIGITAALFASQYDSSVLAIEPHARNLELLNKNVESYRPQITPHRAVVSPDGEPVFLENHHASRLGHHGSYRYAASASTDSATQTMPVITPLEILEMIATPKETDIGILKVNIGGAERELFGSGAMDPLLHETRVLFVVPSEDFAPGSTAIVRQAVAEVGMTQFVEHNGLLGYTQPGLAA